MCQRKKYNLSGRKISHLTVIDYDKTKHKWKCQCDCGKITFRESFFLIRRPEGNKSCGCLHWRNGNRMPNNQAAKNKIFGNYKRNARLNNRDFLLTKEQFENLISKNCFYCDKLPSTKCEHIGYDTNFYYNGIDRLDSNKGYVLENCVPCCYDCNIAKNDQTLENWKKMIVQIYNHFIKDAS